MTEQDSELIGKGPCDHCGSSDANAEYTDGHTYCFSCNHYEHGDGDVTDHSSTGGSTSGRIQDGLISGDFQPLVKRGITEETCRKFGYRVGSFKGRTVQLADYRDDTGRVIAQKVRFPSKEFTVVGDGKKLPMFGQHLWGPGKMAVVTEGEIDALSVSQVQGNKWPVVSLPNGAPAAAKAIKRNLAWFDQYETVVLMFDNDPIGIEAAKECAPLFPVGKCKIASLPLKDASEMLQAGRGSEIITAIWQAKPFRPDGIVRLSDLQDKMLGEIEVGLPWWSEQLTEHTYGRRYGELVALGAGTGVGKTDFLTQQIEFDLNTLGEKVGVFFLEQPPVETGKRIAGKMSSKRFHIPDGSWTQDELSRAVGALCQSDRLYLYDHFGSTDWDIIENRIRFLAVSEGVRLFYLDHLTALAAAVEDERVELERVMARIGGLVQELSIHITLVSHLSTPEGRPHEEGGRVMIRHFKGSRAIGFWCHFMFGLERNQQAEDEGERTNTTFRILKDRFTGQATGETIQMSYDRETGRLIEGVAETSFDDEL